MFFLQQNLFIKIGIVNYVTLPFDTAFLRGLIFILLLQIIFLLLYIIPYFSFACTFPSLFLSSLFELITQLYCKKF